MPPNTPSRVSPPTPEQALQALLTLPQLLELVNLITDISDLMSTRIDDGFDTSYKSRSLAPEILKGNGEMSTSTPALDEVTDVAPSSIEVPATETQVFKADVLEFFQIWRDELITSMIMAAASSKVDEPEAQNKETSFSDRDGGQGTDSGVNLCKCSNVSVVKSTWNLAVRLKFRLELLVIDKHIFEAYFILRLVPVSF
jgi:hypothetical protein